MYCSWRAPWDCWPPFSTLFKGCSLRWGALILCGCPVEASVGLRRAFWGGGWVSVWLAQAGQGDPWASSPLQGGSAGGDCPHLAPPCFPQLHIVHINVKYRTLAEAKGHPNGLAVLGFFFQVGLWGLMLPAGGAPPREQAARGAAGGALYGCPKGERGGRKAGSRPGGAGEPQR